MGMAVKKSFILVSLGSLVDEKSSTPIHDNLLSSQRSERGWIKFMFGPLDSGVQTVRRIVVQNGHDFLCDDWSRIHSLVHEMDCAAGELYPVIERLLPRFQPRKCRQQGGMDINDSLREGAQKFALQYPHETGQHN